jgi:1,4-alpha-glucan branching enzyme
MAKIKVNFAFHSGVKRHLLRNVRLAGSWDGNGQFSNQWTQVAMAASQDETGCDAFTASVSFDGAQAGTIFMWGVVADLTDAPNTWVVATEVADENSNQRVRSFALVALATEQHYWFAVGRRFARRSTSRPERRSRAFRFSEWAPHAKKVEVVFAPFDLAAGTPTGYMADDGTGVDPASAVVPLVSNGDGIWESDIARTPSLVKFDDYMNRLYMYRVTNEQGMPTYKVDIFSRNQVGRGGTNPGGGHYGGSYLDLDGIVSCSVVSFPDQITHDFHDTGVEKQTLIARKSSGRTNT